MRIETQRLDMTFTRNSGDAMEFGTLRVLDKKFKKRYTEHGVLMVGPQRMLERAESICNKGDRKSVV